MVTIFQAFLHVFFYIFAFFHSWQTVIFWDQWNHHPPNNDFVSPGVNNRVELVPSPRTYARNGAPRRWLGENNYLF